VKTYTATQLNKSAQEVFAAVVMYGEVEIKHDRYPDLILTIKGQSRQMVADLTRVNMPIPFREKTIKGDKDGE